MSDLKNLAKQPDQLTHDQAMSKANYNSFTAQVAVENKLSGYDPASLE